MIFLDFIVKFYFLSSPTCIETSSVYTGNLHPVGEKMNEGEVTGQVRSGRLLQSPLHVSVKREPKKTQRIALLPDKKMFPMVIKLNSFVLGEFKSIRHSLTQLLIGWSFSWEASRKVNRKTIIILKKTTKKPGYINIRDSLNQNLSKSGQNGIYNKCIDLQIVITDRGHHMSDKTDICYVALRPYHFETPVLIQSSNLIYDDPGQYLYRWHLWNTKCCKFESADGVISNGSELYISEQSPSSSQTPYIDVCVNNLVILFSPPSMG